MIRTLVVVLALLCSGYIQVTALNRAGEEMKSLPTDTERPLILPSPLVKIASLEYKGLISDMLFLKSMIFIGGANRRDGTPRVQDWEWQWWLKVLDTSTDLDPYFLDPYYYANAFLPWDAGMVRDANILLKKGSSYRTWDWTLPFYLGFNEYFFLQNDAVASEYLMEASRRPGASATLASLAARLAYKGNRTETAILFLEEVLKKTEDERLREHYEKRILALRSVRVLEKGIVLYRERYGSRPGSLDALIQKGILKRIPPDPYGGAYYLDETGALRNRSATADLGPFRSPAQSRRQK